MSQHLFNYASPEQRPVSWLLVRVAQVHPAEGSAAWRGSTPEGLHEGSSAFMETHLPPGYSHTNSFFVLNIKAFVYVHDILEPLKLRRFSFK